MTDPGGSEQGGGDPRKNDYAIVVGVTVYPRLTSDDGRSANLLGSIHDAEKVRRWLEKDDGGGVLPENILYVIRANATPAAVPDPSRDAIVDAFGRMWAKCWRDNGAPKVPMGRRLYVYVSGHGLAADLDHGALLCSNSSKNLKSTVTPFRAVKDFRQAGFFREFVIWFDGCMDWTGIETEAVNYDPRGVNDINPPGPVFTAYAARPRLRTVEALGPDGLVGGVFTRTLLEGLESEAAEPGGQINGSSLQNYLYNAMAMHLPPDAKDNIRVDKQPKINTDPGIIFRTGVNIPSSAIVFHIGAEYEGANAQLWGRGPGGKGLTMLDMKLIANGDVTFSLQNGIYVVVIPQHGLRTGFEVTGGVATKLYSA